MADYFTIKNDRICLQIYYQMVFWIADHGFFNKNIKFEMVNMKYRIILEKKSYNHHKSLL